MTTYFIHEVSAEWRKYVHVIKAGSPEEAEDKFNDGEAALATNWEQGTFAGSVELLDMQVEKIETEE